MRFEYWENLRFNNSERFDYIHEMKLVIRSALCSIPIAGFLHYYGLC